MNEKIQRKVLGNDPREKRNKTPQEISAQWADRRLIGYVFKWVGTVSALVFAYWYVFESGQKFVLAGRLPFKARWSLGTAVACVFLWLIYAFFGYRCPRCQRFHGIDWSLGARFLGFREPPSGCRYCSARFDT